MLNPTFPFDLKVRIARMIFFMVRDDIFMINFNTSEMGDKTGKVIMGFKQGEKTVI